MSLDHGHNPQYQYKGRASSDSDWASPSNAHTLPTVYITPKAYTKLRTYIQVPKGEISGLGHVEKTEKGQFLIKDLWIYEQESDDGSTELDQFAIARHATEIMERGENPGLIKLWWHSHANYSAYFSHTDDTTANRFASGKDWMLSLVMNKAGDYQIRLDMFSPCRLTLVGLPLEVQWQDPKLLDRIAAEVARKVHKPKRFEYKGKGTYAYLNKEGVVVHVHSKEVPDGREPVARPPATTLLETASPSVRVDGDQGQVVVEPVNNAGRTFDLSEFTVGVTRVGSQDI